MEENTNFKAVCELIGHLQNQLTFSETQDCGTFKREIEEHFDRCIRALQARRDDLIQQLENVFQDHGKAIEQARVMLKEKIQKCKERLEAGGALYNVNPETAELFWREASKIGAACFSNAIQQIQITMPAEIIAFINNYGTVSLTQVPPSAPTTPRSVPSNPPSELSFSFPNGLISNASIIEDLLPPSGFGGKLNQKEDMVSTIARVDYSTFKYFISPSGILAGACFNPNEECFYVSGYFNNEVYKITENGVKVFVQDISDPYGIAVYNKENCLFVASKKTIIKISATGKTSVFAKIKGSSLLGIAVDQRTGLIFVSDFAHNTIYTVNQKGEVGIMAGYGQGFVDGRGKDAKFNQPIGLCFDETNGCLLVCDSKNNRIRRVSMEGQVSTVCNIDSPHFAALMADGTILVSSFERNLIFALTPQEEEQGYKVGVLAGNGFDDTIDGKSNESSFDHPEGIAIHEPSRSCLVTEYWGSVRKITLSHSN